MKKICNFLKRNILISSIIYTALFLTIDFILIYFNYSFRQWVDILNVALILVGGIVGIIQLLLKTKGLKVFFIGIFIIGLICIAPIIYMTFVFSYMPEHIVKKEDKKYVAYVNGFWDTYVDYYEYKGPFIVRIPKSIREYYGKGGFDPIENSQNNYEILETTYFDSKGNILKVVKKELEEKNYQDNKNENIDVSSYYMDNIITSDNVKIIEEDSKYYASVEGKEKVQIISPREAANIADIEAKKSDYQYQSWKSEFYSRGKENNEALSAKLCYGLDEIDRLYMWEERWRVESYENKIMWQIRLCDANDPLTSLYIYVDAQNKNIIGAGQMSD